MQATIARATKRTDNQSAENIEYTLSLIHI
jgi:hypothetical protein